MILAITIGIGTIAKVSIKVIITVIGTIASIGTIAKITTIIIFLAPIFIKFLDNHFHYRVVLNFRYKKKANTIHHPLQTRNLLYKF